MKNKVEIRALALELVVRMWGMDKLPVDEVLSHAKQFEGYIIGNADIEEFEDERKMIKDLIRYSKTNPIEAIGMCAAVKN